MFIRQMSPSISCMGVSMIDVYHPNPRHSTIFLKIVYKYIEIYEYMSMNIWIYESINVYLESFCVLFRWEVHRNARFGFGFYVINILSAILKQPIPLCALLSSFLEIFAYLYNFFLKKLKFTLYYYSWSSLILLKY